jgi:hypothetical protein
MLATCGEIQLKPYLNRRIAVGPGLCSQESKKDGMIGPSFMLSFVVLLHRCSTCEGCQHDYQEGDDNRDAAAQQYNFAQQISFH